MRRLAPLLCVAVATLACSGTLPETPPPAPDPTPAPAPAPRQRPERDTDCLQNLEGVLTGVPGYPAGTGKVHPGPLPLHARNDRESRVFASFDREGHLTRSDGEVGCEPGAGDGCLYLTWDHDTQGLPVYDTSGDWVQVAVGKGGSVLEPDARCRHRAWVELAAPLAVEPVAELLEKHGLTHTLDDWTGVLYDGPDGAPRASGFTGATDFTVTSSRRFAGRLWLEVTLVSSHCDEPRERGTGWIPAEDDDGRLQVWYYSAC